MTITELNHVMDFILTSDYEVTLALATFDKEELEPTYRSLNITEGVASDFSEMIAARVAKISGFAKSNDLRLLEYTADYKPEAHELEYISLQDDEIGQLLQAIPNANQIDHVGDLDGFLKGLRFYMLIFSGANQKAIIFRRYNRNKELLRSKNIVMRLVGEQYDRLSEPTFQFDSYLDAILFGDKLIILNKTNFQHIFRYYELLRQVAEQSLATIQENVPIANFAEFRDSCFGHLKKLEKLKNIANKPYLTSITMTDIKETIARFDLSVEVQENDGQEELVFNVADRWSILNLLDDGYLGSQMTGLRYEVNSKREV